MSQDLLAIAAGISDGIENSARNMHNIMLAKHEMNQKDQLFDIQKKKGELDIKEQELTQDPEIVAARKEKFMLDTKLGRLNLDKANLEIKEAETKIKTEQAKHKTQMEVVMPLLQNALRKGGALSPGLTIKSDGSFSLSGGPVKNSAAGSLEELLTEAPADGEKAPAAEGSGDEYTPEEESLIQANVDYHGKTREEIVGAMKKKGLLNG